MLVKPEELRQLAVIFHGDSLFSNLDIKGPNKQALRKR